MTPAPQVTAPAHQLTALQKLVFRDETERFSHTINAAEGMRWVYRCESLQMTRSLLYPKKKQRSSISPKPVNCWFLDFRDGVTFRSLADVADAILMHRRIQARAAILAATFGVPDQPRCGQDQPAASTPTAGSALQLQ